MASLFYDGMMAPKGNQSLTLKQQQELARLRRAGGVPSAALEGEYLPREGGVTRSPGNAGLLGQDPVDSQRQPPKGGPSGRTFYTNTAGQTGTSVPKGAGTSGVYDDIAKAGAKVGGGGLFRAASKLAGPAGVLLEAATPGDLASGELTREQRIATGRAPDAEQSASAVRFAQDAAQRAVANKFGTPRQSLFGDLVVPAVPETMDDAVAKTQQDQEIQRQGIEQGALRGLGSGAISRPEVAKAVVEADAQRSGQELTPEQKQAAVEEEVASMKGMDDTDVAKYVSYALIAGGLLASVLDKSGNTSAAFSSAFNQQLDRNVQLGIQSQRNQQAQAELMAKQAAEAAKADRDERRLRLEQDRLDQDLRKHQETLDVTKQKVQQTGQYQAGLLGQGEERLTNDRTGLALTAQRIKDARERAEREAQRDVRGPDLSTKDAETLVTSSLNQQNLSLSKAAKSALAQQVRSFAKQNPEEFARSPAEAVMRLMQSPEYERGESALGFLPGVNSQELRVRRAKALQ